jgi:hypothetical protein
MSETENNQSQDQASTGEDLTSQLSGGETEFVATEEKKPVVSQGMLYMLLLIAIGGGGTYFMYKRQGPQQAAAASVETAKAQETIDTFLTSGPGGIKMMEEMLRNTEKVVKQFLDYPSVTQVPLSALHTNPFRAQATKADGAPDPDEAKKKHEEERAAALKGSQGLNLQSIMAGKNKACMINNSLYKEGQQIDGFTIEKISSGSVIVKRGAFRFELKMQR